MLTWLNSLNVGGVAAVIAAVIALLRAIVSLVPSPKLAADINPVIAFLAGIVGMSGKEGVQQAGPPITESGKNSGRVSIGGLCIMLVTCLIICTMMFMPSCTTLNQPTVTTVTVPTFDANGKLVVDANGNPVMTTTTTSAINLDALSAEAAALEALGVKTIQDALTIAPEVCAIWNTVEQDRQALVASKTPSNSLASLVQTALNSLITAVEARIAPAVPAPNAVPASPAQLSAVLKLKMLRAK